MAVSSVYRGVNVYNVVMVSTWTVIVVGCVGTYHQGAKFVTEHNAQTAKQVIIQIVGVVWAVGAIQQAVLSVRTKNVQIVRAVITFFLELVRHVVLNMRGVYFVMLANACSARVDMSQLLGFVRYVGWLVVMYVSLGHVCLVTHITT